MWQSAPSAPRASAHSTGVMPVPWSRMSEKSSPNCLALSAKGPVPVSTYSDSCMVSAMCGCRRLPRSWAMATQSSYTPVLMVNGVCGETPRTGPPLPSTAATKAARLPAAHEASSAKTASM